MPSRSSARRGEIRPSPPVAHGSRKLIIVLFVDMVDSTALADERDAESFGR